MRSGGAREALISFGCQLLSGVAGPALRPIPPHLERILVLLPCCVGDVLMATPTVAALRALYPDARIEFAVGDWSRPVLEGNPHLDGIVDCRGVGEGAAGLSAYLDLVRRLRGAAYDACFVLSRSPLMAMIPWLAGIPHRIGLDSQGRGFPLTVRVPVGELKHEAELYLDTVRALGLPVEASSLVFCPTEEDRRRAAALFRRVRGERRTIAIHPGGGVNPGMRLPAKRWPPERFAALADALMARPGWRVVLVGGPSDSPLASQVARHMSRRPPDLTGQLSWGELGAFLASCDVFIGNDTGAMHLAAAVGARVVALFGPSDPRRYGPYGGRGVALWQPAGCNPCFQDGRFRSDCTHPRCILAIPVEQVLQAATGGLDEPAPLDFCP